MAEHVRFRAPLEHGKTLQHPEIGTAAKMIAANQNRFDAFPAELKAIRKTAIREMIDASLEYSQRYLGGDILDDALSDSAPIVISGHQPQLFHPGVWFKNFAIDAIRQKVNGVSINLVVDNDLCTSSSIACPVFDNNGWVRVQSIAFDDPQHGIPYEARQIQSPEVFASFPKRIGKAIAPTVADPLVKPLWHQATETTTLLQSMPAGLAAARHRMERQFGIKNLDLPVSQMAGSTSFARFAALIIHDSQRFANVYNRNLIQFRQRHRIRSRSHPVPELSSDDDWVELPFWIWTTSNPIRRRLFSRSGTKTTRLSDRQFWQFELPSDDIATAIHELNQPTSEVSIRPRALTTTMFTRLFASDAFVHGIGGAKYDQLNDDIMRNFFQIEPPAWFTISATMKLPFDHQPTTAEMLTDLERKYRELRYHPEKFLPDHELAAAKRELIRNVPVGIKKRSWHRKVEEVNVDMWHLLGNKKATLSNEMWRVKKALPQSKILGSREYSFVLFPETLMRDLVDLAGPANNVSAAQK